MESCGLVPGRDLRECEMLDPNPSPSRREGWECGVDDLEPRRISGGGETDRRDAFVLPVPTDPYIDFAFGLDGTTHCDDPKRTNEHSVAIGLDHSSVSETLRRLESEIGPPTGIGDATVDLIPMDIDTMLSVPVSHRLPSGEGETQRRGSPSDNPPNPLPFQPPTSNFPALAPCSSSSPAVATARNLVLRGPDLSSSLEALVQDRPQTPQTSTTVSVSELAMGSTEPASTLVNLGSVEVQRKVIAGPRLFLDDDGME